MIEAQSRTGWGELVAALGTFVRRRVDASDADDVLQNALVRIHDNLPALRDDELFGPWVYRVTRSAIADHLRARERPLAAGRTPLADDLEEGRADGEDDDLRPALTGCLSTFIAELPSPYREAIVLTELEGLTQKEAAAMLGISLSGMKSRVQRGRARLRAKFEQCCAMSQDARGKVTGCDPRPAGGGPPCSPGRSER